MISRSGASAGEIISGAHPSSMRFFVQGREELSGKTPGKRRRGTSGVGRGGRRWPARDLPTRALKNKDPRARASTPPPPLPADSQSFATRKFIYWTVIAPLNLVKIKNRVIRGALLMTKGRLPYPDSISVFSPTFFILDDDIIVS